MGLITWLENHMLACPYKKYFGVECMGCGMQRSLIALLKGNLEQSFYLYPALIPIIIMFVFLVFHLIFKFKNGAKWLKYQFLLIALLVTANFVIKLVRN